MLRTPGLADTLQPMARRRLSVRLLLSLALVLAQVGAVAHVYTHSRSTDLAGGFAEQAQFCAQCQSGTPLLAAADCAPAHFELRPADGAAVLASNRASLIEAGPRHAFQSRAPPHLS